MRRFRYWADPLFLLCCGAYALNRWLLKPHLESAFLHGYFNDLLLIPCALPLVLWLQRRFGWRRHDQPPQWREVFFHLIVWSLLFELIGPHLMRHATGDSMDVAAYALGGIVALGWWNWKAESAAAHKMSNA